MTSAQTETIAVALNGFHIELPSWGFANTGTRFGKFLQPAAASTIEEKFSDAGQVHRWTGICPTVALHVLWDLPQRLRRLRRDSAPGRAARGARRSHQPQHVSGPDLQVRVAGQSRPGGAPRRARPHSGQRGNRQGPGQPRCVAVVRRRLELSRHAEHPPPASMVHGGPQDHARAAGGRSAHAGGVQAVRAGLLSHRHRRLGHGAGAGAGGRAAGQGAGGHRASLPGTEHRADRGVAAGYGHAGRIPFQRPALCRRRPDPGVDRSRTRSSASSSRSAIASGRPGGAPTSPTWWTRATT